MDINHQHKIVTPFLVGQRRDQLARISDLDALPWETLQVDGFEEMQVKDQMEQMRRMGRIYFLLSERIKKVIEDGKVPVSISGDCLSTLGVLAGLQKAGRQPERIVWLDAHGDFHTWETSQTKYLGGMPLAILVGHDGDQETRLAREAFRKAIGVTPYPEDKIILSDARDLDSGEKEALLHSKITTCEIVDVLDFINSDETIYLHWDTDVLDAEEEMPALKYHVKSGPTRSTLSQLFKSFQNKNIVAVSVSAWHSEKDADDRTARECLALLKDLGVNIIPIP